MIQGYVRDYLPRVFLTLPGQDGPTSVEFIVDTAFQGDLTLPSALIGRMAAEFTTERTISLADGSIHRRPYYQIALDWGEESRPVEVTVLENSPLLGAMLLEGQFVQIEMMDGGEVSIEPL